MRGLLRNTQSSFIIRCAVFLVASVIIVFAIPKQTAKAEQSFVLDSNGTSHIYTLFQESGWYTVSGSTSHGGVDYYSDDWNWSNGLGSDPDHSDDDCGKNVLAPFSGNVIYSGWGVNADGSSANGYGYEVVIQADSNNNFAYRAAHLQQGSNTSAGHVNAGDVIGRVGNTSGLYSFSCHLHSVLYKNIYSQTVYGQSGFTRLDSWGGVMGPSSTSTNPNPDGTFATPFYNDATGGSNPGTTCDNVSYNGVRLYDQDSCNGASLDFSNTTSLVNLPDYGWNDRATSLYVKSGWSMKIYADSNAGGASRCIDHSMWDLDADTYGNGSKIGSSISSIIVYNNSTCSGGGGTQYAAEFYADPNYTGTLCYADSAGNWNMSSDCNDQASSLRLKSGWSVRVYEHSDMQGGQKCFTGSDTYLPDDYFDNGIDADDSISSFILYNQSSCPAIVNPPGAPALNSPSNGATINEGQEITLQWSATGDQYYGEIWGGPAGTSTFDWQSSTSKNIGSQWPGYTYYWHIKAKNSAGESGWSATWTFNVKTVDTTAPTGQMTAPPADSVQQGPNIKLTANATDSGSGVNKVEFYAWSGDAWSNQQWILLGTDTSSPYEYNWNVSSLGQTYAYVTIDAYDNAGNHSGLIWDPYWTHFSIDNSSTSLPAAPSLVSPADTSTHRDNEDMTFSWNTVSGATSYYWHMTGGPSIDINSGWITGTSWAVGKLWPGTYQWQVKAKNATGEGNWSATWTLKIERTCQNYSFEGITFFTEDACRDPNMLSYGVATGIVNMSDHPTFNESISSIYVKPSWSVKVYKDANGAGSSRCLSGTMWNLASDQYDGGGVINDSISSVQIFTNNSCAVAVTAPSLHNPSDGSSFMDTANMYLDWYTVSGATGYYAHLTGPGVDRNTGWITSLEWNVGRLSAGTYQWQVKAKNATSESAWSQTRTFIINQTIDCNTYYPATGVKLFASTVCNGSNVSFTVPTSIVNLSTYGYNDTVSSIYVGPNWSVKVYSNDNGSGSSRCLGGSMWDLSVDQYDGGGIINDTISSIQVFDNNSCKLPSMNNAQFVSQVVPTTMVIGKTYQVKVTMKNNGTIAWKQKESYRLGSQNPQDNNTWGLGRVNLSSGQIIKVGSQKTFTFNVVAPISPGTYNFQWKMLRENVEWFGEYSPNVQVSVINNPPTAVKSPTPANNTINQKTQMTLSWSGSTDPDGHAIKYNVYVGTNPSSLSLVSSAQTGKSFKFVGTGLTTYYWKVASVDAYGAITNGPVWTFTTKTDIIPVGSTLYQENDWRLYYTGSWKTVSNASANGGAYKETGTYGSYVEFKIAGNSFSLKRQMGTARGKMMICIDGTICQEVSNYAKSTKWQQTYTYKYIPGTGPHTIRITNYDTKKIDIDAIKVFDSV